MWDIESKKKIPKITIEFVLCCLSTAGLASLISDLQIQWDSDEEN